MQQQQNRARSLVCVGDGMAEKRDSHQQGTPSALAHHRINGACNGAHSFSLDDAAVAPTGGGGGPSPSGEAPGGSGSGDNSGGVPTR